MRFTVVSSAVAVSAAAVLLTPVAAFATTGLDAVRVKGATATGTLQRDSVPVTVALAPRDKAGLQRRPRRGRRAHAGPVQPTLRAVLPRP